MCFLLYSEGILGQRLVGSTPGGFPMKTLKVEDNAGVYTITMSPNNCSYEIPLLGLANAKVGIAATDWANNIKRILIVSRCNFYSSLKNRNLFFSRPLSPIW